MKINPVRYSSAGTGKLNSCYLPLLPGEILVPVLMQCLGTTCKLFGIDKITLEKYRKQGIILITKSIIQLRLPGNRQPVTADLDAFQR